MEARRVEFIRSLSRTLMQDQPMVIAPSTAAAVALVFRDGRSGEELLLIRRSEREEDPWSGQVALPGGRVESADSSFKDTAVRETREEVGINLDEASSFLGYLEKFKTHTRNILVVPAVFLSDGVQSVSLNTEVASFRWVPFHELISPKSRSVFHLRRDGMIMEFPAYKVSDYLVWGLTENILSSLVGAFKKDASGDGTTRAHRNTRRN